MNWLVALPVVVIVLGIVSGVLTARYAPGDKRTHVLGAAGLVFLGSMFLIDGLREPGDRTAVVQVAQWVLLGAAMLCTAADFALQWRAWRAKRDLASAAGRAGE